MTAEGALFRGYRVRGGYSTLCACGTWIRADSEAAVPAAIRLRGSSPGHEEWRCVQAVRRPTTHRCPCHVGQPVG